MFWSLVFAHETRIPSTEDELLKLDRHSPVSDAEGTKKGGIVCIDEIGELTSADFDTWCCGHVVKDPIDCNREESWCKSARKTSIGTT